MRHAADYQRELTMSASGEACQKRAWTAHKKGCQINAMLNKFNAEYAARPVEQPPTTECTGCGVAFDEENYFEDEGPCPDCGYVACESCSCHHSKGACDGFAGLAPSNGMRRLVLLRNLKLR